MKRMLARAFRRRREIPCCAQEIPCAFPAGRKIIPCSPTQGILTQAPRIQGLFGAFLGEKVRIPCKFAARREFFPLAYPRGRMTGLEFLSSRESAPKRRSPDASDGRRGGPRAVREGSTKPIAPRRVRAHDSLRGSPTRTPRRGGSPSARSNA